MAFPHSKKIPYVKNNCLLSPSNQFFIMNSSSCVLRTIYNHHGMGCKSQIQWPLNQVWPWKRMQSANQLWGWRTHRSKWCTHICLQTCFSALWNHKMYFYREESLGKLGTERKGGLLSQWHWAYWWNKNSHSSTWTPTFLLLFLTNNTLTPLGRWSKPLPNAIPWLESKLPSLVQLTSPSTTTGAPGEGRQQGSTLPCSPVHPAEHPAGKLLRLSPTKISSVAKNRSCNQCFPALIWFYCANPDFYLNFLLIYFCYGCD